MSEEINKIVPKLRFPEFKETEEWEIKPLKEVYLFKSTNSFSRDYLNYNEGEFKNIHYGDIHTKFSTRFDITKEKVPFIKPSISVEKISIENYCIEGDMIFADASEDLKDVGKSIELAFLNNEKLLSGLHTLLARQREHKLVVGFGGHLFMCNAIRNQIQKEAQGAKVLGISATRLSNIKIFYPSNKAEQQKIADCLSSLDDLITAQKQKLEALKAHKKGLMQQLFPAEGETVPKLRFEEFEDSGDWEETNLGEKGSASFINEKVSIQQLKLKSYISTENLLPNYEGKTLASRLPSSGSFTQFKKGDVLLSNIRPYLKKVWFANTNGAASNDIIIIRADSKINPLFLSFLLKNDKFINFIMKSAEGVKMPRGDKDLIKEYPLAFPTKEEQQKVADCLSSLDELITAQKEEIEALKAHKKGLMQALFPCDH